MENPRNHSTWSGINKIHLWSWQWGSTTKGWRWEFLPWVTHGENKEERERDQEKEWGGYFNGGLWPWEVELGVSGHSCLGRLKRENEQGKEKTKRATTCNGSVGEEWTWKGFANIWIFVCDWIAKWKKILNFSFLDSFYFQSCGPFFFFFYVEFLSY